MRERPDLPTAWAITVATFTDDAAALASHRDLNLSIKEPTN